MNIYGAVILGVIIGLIFGAAFPDFINEGLQWIIAIFLVAIGFIPAMLYYPWRMVVHPVDPAKWEANKHYFKYKQLGKNFFVCYEPHASRPWKLIFFLRLKISS